MLQTIGILAAIAVIIAIDVPRLLEKKLYRELWVFSFLVLVGGALSIAEALHMKIPNPLDWMIVIYNPVFNLFETWLK